MHDSDDSHDTFPAQSSFVVSSITESQILHDSFQKDVGNFTNPDLPSKIYSPTLRGSSKHTKLAKGKPQRLRHPSPAKTGARKRVTSFRSSADLFVKVKLTKYLKLTGRTIVWSGIGCVRVDHRNRECVIYVKVDVNKTETHFSGYIGR